MGTDIISVGDRVRVFDYDCRDLSGENACFTEGTVVDFIDDGNFYNGRYVVMVDRDMWGGNEMDVRVGGRVFPPVNGRRISKHSKPSSRVELLNR